MDPSVFSDLLEHLSNHKIQVNKYRQSVGEGMSQCFGMVRKRSMAPDLSRQSWLDAKLHHLLMEIGKHVPIHYTSIQLNVNYMCKPHRDKHNEGESCIIGFGEYQGGELVLRSPEDTLHDIKYKPFIFDGSMIEHYTKPWTGNRYTLVYHTVTAPLHFPMIRKLSDYVAVEKPEGWVIQCHDGTLLTKKNGLPHPLKGRKRETNSVV